MKAFVVDGELIDPPADLPSSLHERQAGAFVTVKRHGEVRGCMGTYRPTHSTLAEEIIHNAARAATADPRFPPITEAELGELDVAVDVVSPPEPCEEFDLDPKRYGVIVQSESRRGLLLPDLPGVHTAEEQTTIARRKAGIGPDEPVTLFRFTVERHQE